MSKVMLVNVVNEEESRIAIVSGGLLEELSIETSRQEQIEGNIYKARVVKVLPSLDAVFVDYGRERNGFLAVPDVHPRYFGDGHRGASALKKGQELMVQVRKGEIGQKGAALTTYVSIPGRYFVIMPFVEKRGVSRKIQDDATRGQLRSILDEAGVPEDMGYIARTAAEGRTKQELTRDASYLVRLWKRIQEEHDAARAPALLYQESDIVIRTLRDYFTPSIAEVWVDDQAVFEQAQAFFQAVMPWNQKRLKLYQQKAPLFSKYNLEAQIASIYEKTVPLPSGGSIVIEQTEALVSVDVNSGKTMKGKDIEETAFIANKEAAEEAARQLRLRDLGGLIVVDFIDMRGAGHRSEVKKVLQKVLKEDKARTDIGSISKFGLLELSRQRLKPGAAVTGTTPCPTCGGAGKVKSPESFALSVLRLVQSVLARSSGLQRVLVGIPPDVAVILANRKRRKILELEDDFQVFVDLFAEPALHPNQYYLECRQNGSTRVETNLPDDFPRALLRTPKGLPGATVRTPRPSVYALFGDEEEVREVPVEPPDEGEQGKAEAPRPAAAPVAEGEETPAKKKRRRRRKKKKPEEALAAGAAGAQPSETPAPEPAPEGPVPAAAFEPSGEGPVPAPAPEAEERPAPAEAPPAQEPAKKLSASAKRRLRRRKKKELPAETGQTPAPPPPDALPEPPPAEPAEQPAEAAEPAAPAAPRRRPRRRGRKPADAEEAPTPVEPAEVEAPAPPPAEPPAAAPTGTAPAEKPAKPRRKRPAAKKAPPTEAAAAAPAPEAPLQDAPEPVAPPDADAPSPPKRPAPRKRTRKPKAATDSESGEA
ncbi:MAG: Rne/Rng family ribonuclease [Deferrisomatales bacterium]